MALSGKAFKVVHKEKKMTNMMKHARLEEHSHFTHFQVQTNEHNEHDSEPIAFKVKKRNQDYRRDSQFNLHNALKKKRRKHHQTSGQI